MDYNSPCVLVLADGHLFKGVAFGRHSSEGSMGEVVFNTSLCGYQEIITDPSYKSQLVCFTYPSLGNYGITAEDNESNCPYLRGVIARDYCEFPSNFRSEQTLDSYLKEVSVAGIAGIDTRALVRHIREQGSMQGGIFLLDTAKDDAEQLEVFRQKVAASPSLEGQNLTREFDGRVSNTFVKDYIQAEQMDTQDFKKVLVLDFGIKFAILRNFLKNNMYPVCVGGDIPHQDWNLVALGFSSLQEFDGFFLSNGPGDPAAITNGINNSKYLLSLQKPVFGICLGHQLLSLAQGASTYKLKFGHHGGNQPVKAFSEKQIHITSQNHGFAVEQQSLLRQIPNLEQNKKNILIENLNDNTFEGYFLEEKKLMSVQYHPEACPGPHDVAWLFTRFSDML